MRRNRNSRQGVILLVVLGLLALFTLVAITFVIVASQARRGAVIASKAQQQGTPPDVIVRRAILEVVRGSHNLFSVANPHCLLEDMYGNDGFQFVIPKAPGGNSTPLPAPYTDASFQFDGFQLNYCVGQGSMMFIDVPIVNLPNVPAFDPIQGYYNGRVITMMNGPAGGRSTRILRYVPNPTNSPMSQFAVPLQPNRARLWMVPFLGMSATAGGNQWNFTGAPQPGNLFYINGAPFNGTGFGYNPAANGTSVTGVLNYTVAVPGIGNCEMALLPNRWDPQLNDNTGNYPNMCGFGGADEDYDLPDYQNMMLAGMSWIPGGVQPPFPTVVQGAWNVTHPTLHRPDLVAYWANRIGVQVNLNPAVLPTWYSQIPIALRRKIILRPDPQDHYYDGANSGAPWRGGIPDFSGHVFDPVLGPWDIDNDGDGIFDSIWVDLGMPAETAPDGTLYKPLFAFLIVDLDSRLNLNAHGNRAHYRWVAKGLYQDGEYFDPREEALIGPYAIRGAINWPTTGATFTSPQGYPVTASGAFAGGFPQVLAANGMGYSPAEVNLATLLSYPGNWNWWKNSTWNPTSAPGLTYNPYASYVQVPDNFGETFNAYRWLLEGRTGNGRSTLVGRYGEKHLLMKDFAGFGTAAPSAPGWPRYGDTGNSQFGPGYPTNMSLGAKPGITTQGLMAGSDRFYTGDDNAPVSPMGNVHGNNLLQLKGNHFTETGNINIGGYNNNQLAGLIQVGHYGTYMDVTGSSSIGLDTRGQPLSIATSSVANSITLNANAPGQGVGGQGLFYYYGNPTVDATTGYPKTIDDPTEIDLSRGVNYMTYWFGPTGDPNQTSMPTPFSFVTDVDAPFNIAELEVMLRKHDVNDNSLPNRLATLVPTVTWDNQYSSQAQNWRRWATTDSWDIPSPSILPTAEISYGLRNLGLRTFNLSLMDLFRGKLAAYDIKNNGSTSLQSVNTRLNLMIQQQLISSDLMNGLRMDINRVFGNATDDDGNLVIDEPNEYSTMAESLWQRSVLNNGNGIPSDENNDGMIYADPANPQADNFARQQFARQLYVLLMLFKDQGYTHPLTVSVTNNGNSIEPPPGSTSTGAPWTPQQLQQLTAVRLAQYAINVVDFRDRDHIMTPFEFDLDPFNNGSSYGVPRQNGPGWGVDNKLGYGSQDDNNPQQYPWRGLVWGCESQELLISEAVAFHDKRIKDTKYDTGPTGMMGMPYKYPMQINQPQAMPPFQPNDIDPDPDQYRQPQGSAFIELYACGNGNTWGAFSGDLYAPPLQGAAGGRPSVLSNSPLVRIDNPPLLWLGKMSLQQNGTPYAVWRLAVTRSPLNSTRGTGKENNDIRQRMHDYPDTFSLQSDLYMGTNLLQNQLKQAAPTDVRLLGIGIERIVWLGDVPPTPNVIDYNKMYWNQANGAATALQPGQYAVIGPRALTAIGRTYPTTPAPKRVPAPIQPQRQQFLVLNGNMPGSPLPNNPLSLYKDNTTSSMMYPYPLVRVNNQTGGDIQLPLTVFAATTPPAGSAIATLAGKPGAHPTAGMIGFNISEPLPMDPNAAKIYYSAPQFFPDPDGYSDGGATVFPIYDCLGDESNMNPYPDQPFDYQKIVGKLQDSYFGTDLYDSLPDIQGGTFDGTRTDTIPAVKTILLQRLANPLMTYNPGPPDPNYQAGLPINPYVTVDWMPIDLTVFNSEDPKQVVGGAWSPQTDDTSATYGQARAAALPAKGERKTAPVLQFETRQRGTPRNPKTNFQNTTLPGSFGPVVRPEAFNIWMPVTDMPASGTPITSNQTLDNLQIYPQPSTPVPQTVGQNFNLNLDHTIGYLNLPFHFAFPTTLPDTNPATVGTGKMMPKTSRWIDSQFLATLAGPPSYKTTDGSDLYAVFAPAVGDPLRPFPWLVWNNRPFANNMELMMVPSSAPARILHEFTYRRNSVLADPQVPAVENHYATQYNPPAYDSLGNNQLASINYASYAHLLNFFHSTPCNAYPGLGGVQNNPNNPDPFQPNPISPPNGSGVNGTLTRPLINASGNYYRLLEFLHVPSRFSGTEDLLNPAVYQGVQQGNQVNADLQPFCAPFNRVSRFREPGRVNINGLRDASWGVTFQLPNSTNTQSVTFNGMTFSAMLNGYPQDTSAPNNIPWFTSLWESRQGYNVAGLTNAPYRSMYTSDFLIPTTFANPFRSYNGSNFVPLDLMRKQNCSPGFPYRSAIESTLLRPTPLQVDTLAINLTPPYTPTNPTTPPVPTTPMLAPNMVQQAYRPTALPIVAPDHARNTDRNPYFRYIAYNRLGSVTTQRSNVYAGWITMGRFAVDRVAVDLAHPDGLRLVRELGSATGDIHRRRAFFLMDRSIPVGFQRGENMNVDKCILLHRVIE